MSPPGTTENYRLSIVPTGLENYLRLIPSNKLLGYYHMSLQDNHLASRVNILYAVDE
jgi:hypothetical protein